MAQIFCQVFYAIGGIEASAEAQHHFGWLIAHILKKVVKKALMLF
jgi:hypothetical protein